VRRGLIQLAWRFLRFQKDSALAQWYRGRTEDVAGKRKTTMIVALAITGIRPLGKRNFVARDWRPLPATERAQTGQIPIADRLRYNQAIEITTVNSNQGNHLDLPGLDGGGRSPVKPVSVGRIPC